MTIKHAAASLAALSLLVSAPAMALAGTQAAAAPIVVTSVTAQPAGSFGYQQISLGGAVTEGQPGFVSVTYHNTAAVAATDVVFELVDNGLPVGRISDVGTFAPGVTIKHVFNNFSPAEQITVAEVKFADGSVWSSAPTALRQAGS